jgi:phosphohistidine phosphatase
VQQQSGTTPRVLVVMRHARAEQGGPTDFERHLSERGRGDAQAAGRWLATQGVVPDHVLVSAAVRTIETWEAVAEAAGWQVDASHDRGLYDASPEMALDLVREIPADVRTAVVIGHNPTIAYVAHLLDDGDGDPEVATQMALGYPTGALTVFEHDGAWADLEPASARVVAFHVGRA